MDIRRWEFNAFAVQAFLLAATIMTIAIAAGRRLISMPQYVWFGLGLLLMLLSSIPAESAYFRARKNRELPLWRSIAFSILGAAVGTVVYRLMQ